MNLLLTIESSIKSVTQRKLRSLLTTLGIIIGVISIIVVMAISEGAKIRVREQIEQIGTNFVIVISGSAKFKHAGRARSQSPTEMTLKKRDFDAIVAEADKIQLISPGVQLPSVATYLNSNWSTLLNGVSECYFDIRNWELTHGNFFSEQDITAANRVAILGARVKKELFESENAIGQIIRINKIPFKVIGVLKSLGSTPTGMDQDDLIFAPISTVQRRVMNVHNFSAFIMSAKSKNSLDDAAAQVRSILRQMHKIQPGDEDDFTIFSQSDIAQAAGAASAILGVLLLVIASISLIVGGIGIMNIMLVTVTERTKEIGIRMAIGATSTQILRQFIIEAIIICLAGGLIGLALGIILSKIIGFVLGWPIFVPLNAILLSFLSSVFVGIFFGYYPARKASNLDPVKALSS